MLQVQCGRNDAVPQRQHGEDRLHRADRADRMAERGLRCVHRRPVAPSALLMALPSATSPTLVPVACALTWSISVGDSPASWMARVIACPACSPLGSGATMWYPSEVTLAPMSRARMLAPRDLCVLLGLDDEQRAALAEDETVAVPVERAAGAGRVVVGGGQHDAHLGEPGDRHRFDPGLHAAADRDVGLAEHDVAPGVRDGFRAGCAGRDQRADPGPGLAFQPDRRGGAVGHVHLHDQRRHGPQTPWHACRRRRTAVPRLEPMPVPIDTINRAGVDLG